MSKLSDKSEQAEKLSDEVRLPNSEKIYVEGTQAGVRVPFREIRQNVTKNFDGTIEENPPVRVYDSSGPWDDPSVRCDVREGLPGLRREWIIERGDVEEYEGRNVKPEDNGYLTVGAEEYARSKEKGKLEEFPGLRRAPLRAKPSGGFRSSHRR
jgi:phosphomethylpyrimidine synthase